MFHQRLYSELKKQNATPKICHDVLVPRASLKATSAFKKQKRSMGESDLSDLVSHMMRESVEGPLSFSPASPAKASKQMQTRGTAISTEFKPPSKASQVAMRVSGFSFNAPSPVNPASKRTAERPRIGEGEERKRDSMFSQDESGLVSSNQYSPFAEAKNPIVIENLKKALKLNSGLDSLSIEATATPTPTTEKKAMFSGLGAVGVGVVGEAPRRRADVAINLSGKKNVPLHVLRAGGGATLPNINEGKNVSFF